jgi:hypothetical protein
MIGKPSTAMLKKFFTKISNQPLWFFLLLSLIAAWRFFTGLDTNFYQCDEYSYLRKSSFAQLYFTGQFSHPNWQSGDAYDQTKLMEYIYALPSYLLYQQDFISLAQQESDLYQHSYINYGDWAKSYGQPANQLDITPKLTNVLILARFISASFALSYVLLASLIIFWLTKRSYLITSLAFLFLLTHPIITIHGKQALADSALNFFFTLGLINLLFIWQAFFFKKLNLRRLKRLVFLSGLIAGLAASLKLNGFSHLIISQFIFFFAALIYLKTLKPKKKLKTFFRLSIIFLSSAFLAIAVFMLLHPTTWPHPLKSFQKFITWRWWLTGYYQGYFPEDAITSLSQKLQFIFLRPAGYMTGVGSLGFHYQQLFGDPNQYFYLIPNLIFFLSGLYYLLTTIRLKKTSTLHLPVLLWSLSTIIITTSYLKLDWTRYYWPLFLPFLIINSYGLKFLFSLIKKPRPQP